jgi:phage baseplate assembly protein gpV
MEHTITFWTPPDAEHKLIVTFEDGTTQEYAQADKEQYLADHPGRAADVAAMGW